MKNISLTPSRNKHAQLYTVVHSPSVVFGFVFCALKFKQKSINVFYSEKLTHFAVTNKPSSSMSSRNMEFSYSDNEAAIFAIVSGERPLFKKLPGF